MKDPFLLRAADRLYAECEKAIRERRLGARGPIGDATLDYREMRYGDSVAPQEYWRVDIALGLAGSGAPITTIRLKAADSEEAVHEGIFRVLTDLGTPLGCVGDLRYAANPLVADPAVLDDPAAPLKWENRA